MTIVDDGHRGFADIDITHAKRDVAETVAAIRSLAANSLSWEIMERESEQYTHGCRGDGVIVKRCMQPRDAAVAVATSDSHATTMYVANIVPRDGSLSSAEYNAIAKEFVTDFRCHVRKCGLPIRCAYRLPKVPETLSEIIPGKKTRRLFEQFLVAGSIWGTATITHPADIDRLDRFICRVHRWGSHVDFAALGKWLMRENGWKQQEAEWLVQRAEIGLAVLTAELRIRRPAWRTA